MTRIQHSNQFSRAAEEMNRIKQAVNNCRGGPLTHKQAERILEPWRALRWVL